MTFYLCLFFLGLISIKYHQPPWGDDYAIRLLGLIPHHVYAITVKNQNIPNQNQHYKSVQYYNII